MLSTELHLQIPLLSPPGSGCLELLGDSLGFPSGGTLCHEARYQVYDAVYHGAWSAKGGIYKLV